MRFIITLIVLLTHPLIAFSYQNGMVVSEHKLASIAGAKILNAGGNAIDAAVATAYALAVVTPCCGNIGGGGFMTIHLENGQNFFLNFREKAPLLANKNMFLDAHGKLIPNLSTKGYLAVGVPGTVLGLETALKKFGKLSREVVMQPAIELAEQGYILSPYSYNLLKAYGQSFLNQPHLAAIYSKNGVFLPPGSRIIQHELAKTLRDIAAQGSGVFYHGWIAQTIVAESQQHGGLLSLKDFADYNVQFLNPIHCHYRGYDIISSPPPSSGGITLCEMLNILNYFPLTNIGFRSLNGARIIIEAMRYGFTDRNTRLGDPDFIKNPINELLSEHYAKSLSEKINASIHDLSGEVQVEESLQTTHFSVMDKKGNAVAMTFTLNGAFGAGVAAANTGFLLNNQMDDFASGKNPNKFGLVQSEANSIAGGKRPLSSMTPTIVLDHSNIYIVIGSPGGPRIITAVLLTLLNVIDYHMTLQNAVSKPRFHYQVTPNIVDTEPFAFSSLTKTGLEWYGYHLFRQEPWSAVESILVQNDGTVIGVNDPRRPDGAAIAG